jgi:hypothetical protein
MLLAADAAGSGIYQWRDAEGRLHFGDQPPETAVSENLSERYSNTLPFEIIIDGIGYQVPVPLRDKLATSVVKIFAIYRQALDIQYADAREFRIMIYGSEAEFRQYQKRVAPVLENAAGFYSTANNQITTWAIPNEQALLRLIIHECSHAISAASAHNIPTWLNEGLAEYFEQLHLHGLSAEVPLNRHWLQALRQSRFNQDPEWLASIVSAPHQRWYAANGPENMAYAASWSLVWYLMDSTDGRKLISRLLTSAHPDEHASRRLIDRHWPGGFIALEQSWRRWHQHAKGKHRY